MPTDKAGNMKVTILGSGTSQGVPVIACECEACRSTDTRDKRLRSSIMLDIGDRRLIVDVGPDFRYQMLREGVKRVHAVLLTHAHKDHIGGIDDLRAFNWVQRGEVDLYCDAITATAIRKDYDYSFAPDKYPGVPDLRLHVIDREPFHINEIKVEPIPVMHHKLPVTAYRIANFAYLTDLNHIPNESMRRLQGLECLVIGALRKETHVSHFSLEQALEVIEQLHVKQAYITHVGHQMGLSQEVERELPPNVHLAYDRLSFSVLS
jgi:phosphoribosyl 1,2-cyclic phosphate phosphodiesterase